MCSAGFCAGLPAMEDRSGIEGKFLANLSDTVIALSKDGYPELEEKKVMIFKVLTEEEDKFNKTIDQGLAILSDMEEEMKKGGSDTLSGAGRLQALRYLRLPAGSYEGDPGGEVPSRSMRRALPPA